MSFRSQIWDGTKWVSLAAGSGSAPVFDLLHSTKPFPDTPDDDFGSTVMDPKWTVVSGASGVVDRFEAGEVEKYSLTDRPGWFLMQAGSVADQKVELRQDWTMGDGESIVAAIALSPVSAVGADLIVGGEQYVGIGINDTDTGYDAGVHDFLFAEIQTDGYRISAFDGSAYMGTSSATEVSFAFGHIMFLRIGRVGTTYWYSASHDGTAWMSLGSKVRATAPDNLWIFAESVVASSEPVPIHAVAWIRQGTNAFDPWDPHAAVSVAQQEFGTLQFYEPDLSAVIVGDMPLYTWSNRRITAIHASVGTAPSGGSVDVNVVVNGTTDALTTDLSILTTEKTASTTTINNPTWNSGSYITIDVPAVQTPAADLIVYIEWEDI